MYGRLSNLIGFGNPETNLMTDGTEIQAQQLSNPTNQFMTPEESQFYSNFNVNQNNLSNYDFSNEYPVDDYSNVPTPQTQQEFDSLPSGSVYRDDEGIKRKGTQQLMPSQNLGGSGVGAVPDLSEYIDYTK
jgi:hypothetical protein